LKLKKKQDKDKHGKKRENPLAVYNKTQCNELSDWCSCPPYSLFLAPSEETAPASKTKDLYQYLCPFTEMLHSCVPYQIDDPKLYIEVDLCSAQVMTPSVSQPNIHSSVFITSFDPQFYQSCLLNW